MIIDNELREIVRNYWADYQKKKDMDYIVKPSIPIIWFGNLKEYKKSKKRIVTVAINPSFMEFKEKNSGFSLFRFPECEELLCKSELNDNDVETLYYSLNNYFDNKPYTGWFDSYEFLLNLLDSSYYLSGQQENISIHIDAYTALSTEIVWGNSNNKSFEEIKKSIKCEELFNNLLDYLDPDIVLVSINQKSFGEIFKIGNLPPIKEYYSDLENRKPSGYIKVYKKKSKDNKKERTIILGRNWSKPFLGRGCNEQWKKKIFNEMIDNNILI